MTHLTNEYTTAIDKRLHELIFADGIKPELADCMAYSVFAGGKRIRPLLCLLSFSLVRNDWRRAIDVACALELIHTYSLIHDDLPAMDDDILRRGKPTSHVQFGEANAVLAGDALLNLAFETLLRNAVCADDKQAMLNAADCIAAASGARGMIAGQFDDVALEGSALTLDELLRISGQKTGALLSAACLGGVLAAGLEWGSSAAQAAEHFGRALGLAFQINDDILDAVSTPEQLGKSIGKDAFARKTTFASLLGIDKAAALARRYTDEACAELEAVFGERAAVLTELARGLQNRSK